VLTGAANSQTVVAALGDSLTQGYGLQQQDGFVPQLESWLRERGSDVRIVNAGVSGDTTAGGLARIAWTLTPEIDALIVTLGGNDLLRGISPETSRANLEGILQVVQDRGLPVLLVGFEAPGNYGPDYKTAFDAIYPELVETYGTLYVESFLAALESRAETDRAGVLSAFMQSDGVHPNRDGVALIVEALGPEVENLIARVD